MGCNLIASPNIMLIQILIFTGCDPLVCKVKVSEALLMRRSHLFYLDYNKLAALFKYMSGSCFDHCKSPIESVSSIRHARWEDGK